MIELKSPNPSGYDTKYIINFHKPDVSVQQTEYSDVLKRLNEKLAVGSISKETYDEAVTAVYRRFPALTENLSDLQEIPKIPKISKISKTKNLKVWKVLFSVPGFPSFAKELPEKSERQPKKTSFTVKISP